MVATLVVSVYLYTHQTPVSTGEEPLVETPQDLGPLYVYSPTGERGPLLEPVKNALQVDSTTGNAILAEQENYILEYFPENHTFNITLLGNNLRESRITAEQELLRQFSITQEQACSLKVMVGTIVSVSQEFSGRQLGLSFCPGRVDLPESVSDPLEAGSSSSVQPDTAL